MERSEFVDFARREQASLLRLAVVVARGATVTDAEDLVQSAFEKVYLRWDGLKDPSSYARRIIINAANDGRRQHARIQQIWRADSRRADSGAENPFPAIDESSVILSAVGRLPKRQRETVLLRYWLDLSEAETARILGCSVGTVKSQASLGLKTVRQALELTQGGGLL